MSLGGMLGEDRAEAVPALAAGGAVVFGDATSEPHAASKEPATIARASPEPILAALNHAEGFCIGTVITFPLFWRPTAGMATAARGVSL